MPSLFVIRTDKGENLQSKLLDDWNWPMRAFEHRGKLFYFHQHYFSTAKTFAFYVTMAEHSSEADKYLAKMTLKNQNDDRKSLSIAQNVISMDLAPSDSKAVLASKSVIYVPWRTMSGFMKWRDITKEGKLQTESNVDATIHILVN